MLACLRVAELFHRRALARGDDDAGEHQRVADQVKRLELSPSSRIAIAERNTGTRWKNGAARFGPISATPR
ncbi:hypothetical protein BRDID11002_39880 [Bradyrhizobium diazoefficiens]